jgi:hypothetical protein
MRARAAGTIALAWTATRCVIPATGGDAGNTDAGSETVGDQCSSIAAAYCQRAQACNAAPSLSECIANEAPTCCVGSRCGAISRSSRSAVDSCTSTIALEDCYGLVTMGVSILAACQGIPQAP